MSEHFLQAEQVAAVGKEAFCERVPEGMWAYTETADSSSLPQVTEHLPQPTVR